MSNLFIGQLLLVPYNFAPHGWAFASGQILPISQNTALFSLLGTTYGGDGKSTFALPDLRGRIPIGAGQGPGLQNYDLGEQSGEETITLLTTEMPLHNHGVQASGAPGGVNTANGNSLARGGTPYALPAGPVNQTLSPNAARPAGGNLPHDNMMPYLTLNWVIALQGVFPARS